MNGLTLYGPPGIYPNWAWLMNGGVDGSGVSSTINPLLITAPGNYRLTLSTGFCPTTFGDMNVTEHECRQCVDIVYSVTATCDAPSNSAGYVVTFYFNSPYGVAVSGTIGTDIGAVNPMPLTIPPGSSSATLSFTTLDIPPPSFTNGWLHVGDCWDQFKIILPSCTWTAEKHSNPLQPDVKTEAPTGMLVYPNPAQQMVTVTYDYGTESKAERKIVMYDIYGRTVASQAATGTTGSYVVQLSDIAAGAYLIRMEENGHTVQLQHLTVTH